MINEISGKMASSMNLDEVRDRLKKFREDQVRNSDEVVELWESYLSAFTHKLGNDLWVIYEQVCMAALDCGRYDIAGQCIRALDHNFSGSNRVLRLKGLYHEAREDYEKAEKIYEAILEEDSTNSTAKKRMIAMLKAQNKIPDAIKMLNDYLKSFMSDYEAWMELSDMYLHLQDYSKAGFCVEELIMSNPHNHLYYQRYAEIKYTKGEMEEARKYFSQALKLKPTNMRALFGLLMSASNLASSGKGAKAKADNMRYASWAAHQISQRYKENSKEASQEKDVEDLLSTLRITQS